MMVLISQGVNTMMTDDVTYDDLVKRFGDDRAQELLQTIENLADIHNETISFDQSTRFNRALAALNDIDFADRAQDATTKMRNQA